VIFRYVPRAVATAAALALSAALTGCSSGTAVTHDPSVADVRAATAAYLTQWHAEIASLTVKDHHVGLYVRGVPDWSLDAFVEQLPAAAETARAVLQRWPGLRDVDVCGDGPWLPHPNAAAFVPAVRVQLFRDRMARLPDRFSKPEQVLAAGGPQQSIGFYLDPRIITRSEAYRRAFRANAT
jgi:hypothetical protein